MSICCTIFAKDNKLVVEVKFNEEYLRDLYETGKSDKKHRFQPQIIKR